MVANALDEGHNVVAGFELAVLEFERGRMSQSFLLSIEFAEIFVLDLLLADSNLLGVGERVGHPLLRVAFFVLLSKDSRLHLFHGDACLGVEIVEKVVDTVVGTFTLDLVVVEACITMILLVSVLVDHFLEKISTQIIV